MSGHKPRPERDSKRRKERNHHRRYKHRSHYHQGRKAPNPKDVGAFLEAVSRYYQKRRDKVDKVIAHYLKKHNIVGTNTAEYWRLKGICIALGSEVAYTVPTVKH